LSAALKPPVPAPKRRFRALLSPQACPADTHTQAKCLPARQEATCQCKNPFISSHDFRLTYRQSGGRAVFSLRLTFSDWRHPVSRRRIRPAYVIQ
jgi:hypothetical protein